MDTTSEPFALRSVFCTGFVCLFVLFVCFVCFCVFFKDNKTSVTDEMPINIDGWVGKSIF